MKNTIKQRRIEKKWKLKELAALLNLDATLLSRFESGQRLPTRMQVLQMAKTLELDQESLLQLWMRDKILLEYGKERSLSVALAMVQDVVTNYSNSSHALAITPILMERLEKMDKGVQIIQAKRKQMPAKNWESLMLEYTFESNRIEGNTLTLQETGLIISHGLTISGKSMREHLEAVNHHDAIDFIRTMATHTAPLTERDIMQIHNLVLRGIDSANAGKLRQQGVIISGSSHVPPAPEHLREEMDVYMNWYKENFGKLHPVLMAADIHEKFVSMHPFIDGNGRTSRLLMNLHLLQFGYPLVVFKGDSKSRLSYYETLDNARSQPLSDCFRLMVMSHLEEASEKWQKLI